MADHDGFPFPFARRGANVGETHLKHKHTYEVISSVASISLSSSAGLDLFSPTITPSDTVDGQLLPSILSPPLQETTPASPTVGSPDQSLALQDVQDTFNRAFADAIPHSTDLPTPPQEKPKPLRLPSFQVLGIANPHANSLSPGIGKIPLEPIAAFPNTILEETAVAGTNGGSGSMQAPCSDLFGYAGQSSISMLPSGDNITPPEDSKLTGWSNGQLEASAGLGPETTGEQIEASSSGGGSGGTLVTPNPVNLSVDDATAMDDRALRGIIDKIRAYPHQREAITHIADSRIAVPDVSSSPSLQVLSHSLPSPRLPGHAYARIIEAVRSAMPSGRMTWINLLHAVPGRFNMSDLPSSPPDTPGQPLGDPTAGEDYFTTKTFESARQTIDYGCGESPQLLRHLGKSSNALAPPGTVDLAIVERYVPPASTREFDTMFSTVGPSLLVDRLVELSRNNGHLIFMYPTRKGAAEFCGRYLGPIIDPLMRSMAIINDFSENLSREVGTMYAAEKVLEFEILRLRIEDLCKRLSRREEASVRRRLDEENGPSSSFSVSYAQRHHVFLEREVWAEWWVKQEKTKVRAAIDREFLRPGRGHPGTSRQVVLEGILEGIASRPYGPGCDPAVGIEVGVFVVRRESAPST